MLAVGLASLALWPDRAGAEAFLDVFTGVNYTRDSGVRIKQPAAGNDFTVQGLSFEADPGDKAPYYGVRAGYVFGQAPARFGLAVEFFHFKTIGEVGDVRQISGIRGGAPVDARVPVNTVVQQFELSNGLTYVTLDALARYGLLTDTADFPHGRLQVYAGVGAGPAIAYTYSTIDGVKRAGGYEVAGAGVQAFAGVRFLVWKHLGLFVEGKYTHSWLTVGVAKGGHAEVTEESAHVVGGLTAVLP